MPRRPAAVLALLAALALPLSALAGGYGYAPAYHSQEYHEHYQPLTAYFQVLQVTTPPPVTVSAAAYQAEQAQAATARQGTDATAQALAKIADRLDRIERCRAAAAPDLDLPPLPQVPTAPAPPSGLTEPPAPAAGPASTKPPRPALAQVLGVLQQHGCIQCHAGSAARDSVRLYDDAGAWEPNVTPEEIYKSVRNGRMPKGQPGQKLRPDEVALVKAWAEGQ